MKLRAVELLLAGVVSCVSAQSCTTSDGGHGSCEATSSPCSGIFYKGLCPGPANIECCATNWGSCSAAGSPGTCEVKSACKGSIHSGLCPGPSNVECCVSGGPSKYLPGIDVSSYQGSPNWASVMASGVKFACTKATEGTTFTDPTLRSNWAGMHANGLARCAYHFGHPGTDAVAQANYFVAAVKAVGGWAGSRTLPLMLDLEVTDGASPAAVWAWVQAFMGQVKALTGRPGIIYVGYYFWVDSVGNPTSNLGAPLWVASYTASPSVPRAWSAWTFWQYNDNGKIPGISGNVDVDYFQGTEAELQALCFP